jgi:hypothetical protein
VITIKIKEIYLWPKQGVYSYDGLGAYDCI